ncbi:antitoxin [Lysobacteraceae bacterium NML120232]|nr:antitoxin [Xanthomonadaceae bacterium NML08-0793]PJK11673.1 antitoxin [Xanthomonadaceae bacterium NML120232]
MNAQLHHLDPLISEFETAEAEAAYREWVLVKVAEARACTKPVIPHDQVMAEVEALIASKRARV